MAVPWRPFDTPIGTGRYLGPMLSKRTVGMLIAGLALAAAAGPAAADERPRTWASGGFGLGTGGSGDGLTLDGAVVHQRGPHYFALRGFMLADPFDAGASSTRELALLYGRSATRRYGHVAVASGLAAVTIDPCGTRLGVACTTLGVPFVAEAALQPLPVLGIGLRGFANVNAKGSFAGALVFLQVGWMP